MNYATLDKVITVFVDPGPDPLLGKNFDIKEAYCSIPVHSDDRPWLGMALGGRI